MTFWYNVSELTVCINPEHLVFIDLIDMCNNMTLPWSGDETNVVSYTANHGKNGGISDADGRSFTIETLFLPGSDWILWTSTLDEDQNCQKAFALGRFR